MDITVDRTEIGIQAIDYYKHLIGSNAFVWLSNTAKVLYFYMLDYANGRDSSEYPKSMWHVLFTDKEFAKAIKELETHGFIVTVHREKQEDLYYFIDDYKNCVNYKKRK